MTTYVKVKYRVDGVHCFKEAFGSHSYLRYKHRHTFHIMLKVEVFHNNREIEFFALKNEIKELFAHTFEEVNGFLEFGESSCEDLAKWLLERFDRKYSITRRRKLVVSVSEDGDNEAEVDNLDLFPPEQEIQITSKDNW